MDLENLMKPIARQTRYATTKLKMPTKAILDKVTVSSIPSSFPIEAAGMMRPKTIIPITGEPWAKAKEKRTPKALMPPTMVDTIK